MGGSHLLLDTSREPQEEEKYMLSGNVKQNCPEIVDVIQNSNLFRRLLDDSNSPASTGFER